MCPTDLVIHIYSAYYGIQKDTLSLCNELTDELPKKCYYSSVFDQINSTCEYQNTCSIKASSNSFSIADPCPTYPKQLFIQYQCVDNYGLNSTINQCSVNKQIPLICPLLSSFSATNTEINNLFENTTCDTDNSPMTINCNSGEKIEVLCAFYGLHPSIKSCTLPSNPPVCYFASSFTNVNATCSGQQTCSISLTNFSDPCFGMDKGLYVQWRCNK